MSLATRPRRTVIHACQACSAMAMVCQNLQACVVMGTIVLEVRTLAHPQSTNVFQVITVLLAAQT